MIQSYSSQYQDLFVLSVLDNKKQGTYIEFGAQHPVKDNNTYLLETEFLWTGTSIEWDVNYCSLFNFVRKNKCLCVDATLVDTSKLFNNTDHIDFLQLDLDPPKNTFKVLQNIDFSKISFSIITFEHDLYAGGHYERIESRKILEDAGYTRVISDVIGWTGEEDVPFEDWYINEKYMPNDNWKKFIGENVSMQRNPNKINHDYLKLFKEFNLL